MIVWLYAMPNLFAEGIPAQSEFPSFVPTLQSGRVVVKVILSRDEKSIFYGLASWYSETDPAINLHTANGEIFDDTRMTCASWDFPFGTLLKVTNLKNGKSVVCRVNDRGPAKRLGRLIDVTKHAYNTIASTKSGLTEVSVAVISLESALQTL